MSFTSLFKKPVPLVCAAIFLAVEILARVAPLEMYSGAAIYLTVHRRQLLDAEQPEFDYLIFGESKSLSIRGHRATAQENWSVYNFSMPAMGSRYFSFLLEKYLAHRKRKPAALIFAGDPGVFQQSWNTPLHDPGRIYSDSREDPLWRYLYYRVVRRIPYGFSAVRGPQMPQEAAWDSYSHRFLHLFSPAELAGQYTGAERIFVLREAAPLQYYTFRYRDALRGYVSNPRPALPAPRPVYCQSCSESLRNECRSRLPNFQDNALIRAQLARDYGAINLGERIEAANLLQYNLVREKLVTATRQMFDGAAVDLGPLQAILDVARRHGVRVAMAAAPTVDQYGNARYYVEYRRQLAQLLAGREDARQFDFARPYLTADSFVDQIHYNCEAARSVNEDFYRNVMPRILAFAPPASGEAAMRNLDERAGGGL
ncbi:MAG: hypothetical protein K1X75_10635 [Leptospirales bacterium]|nr:hypothetical protein [Leptospirales bacterium]